MPSADQSAGAGWSRQEPSTDTVPLAGAADAAAVVVMAARAVTLAAAVIRVIARWLTAMMSCFLGRPAATGRHPAWRR